MGVLQAGLSRYRSGNEETHQNELQFSFHIFCVAKKHKKKKETGFSALLFRESPQKYQRRSTKVVQIEIVLA